MIQEQHIGREGRDGGHRVAAEQWSVTAGAVNSAGLHTHSVVHFCLNSPYMMSPSRSSLKMSVLSSNASTR